MPVTHNAEGPGLVSW